MPSPHSSILGNILAAAACLLLAAGHARADGIEAEYIAAGIFETGLTAEMPADADCPAITLGFASRLNRSGRRRKSVHGSFHAGVDWALPEGTPIVAIADGLVVDRGDDPGGSRGNYVVIEHPAPGEGIRSSYVHLSGFNVEDNQEVNKGQVIGYVGGTGRNTTFVHLHLNVFGKEAVEVGKRRWRYRYDYLQFLSGDMTPIDPVKKRRRKVNAAYMDQAGKVHPPGARVIWPFICQRRTH